MRERVARCADIGDTNRGDTLNATFCDLPTVTRIRDRTENETIAFHARRSAMGLLQSELLLMYLPDVAWKIKVDRVPATVPINFNRLGRAVVIKVGR